MTTQNAVAPRNGLATTSLIFGILALVGGFFITFLGGILGLVSIITGVIALGQIKQQGSTGKGIAIAGIVFGILAFVWVFVYFFILGPAILNAFNTINNSLQSVP